MLPSFIQTYFWDVDATALEVERDGEYIISRLLERGDSNAARWMRETYPRERIISVLTKSRELSAPSAYFWADFYNVPASELKSLCSRTQSPTVQ